MISQLVLVKAIRSGKLADVQAALDAGAPVEAADDQGDPGLPMGVACFMGFVDIVRELARRGARVNLADNSLPTSPLSMAVRGGKTEVARALVELGADVPAGMKTGLTDHEIMLAQWIAQRNGLVAAAAAPAAAAEEQPMIEEIELKGCFGTDTQVLDAEMLRAARGGD